MEYQKPDVQKPESAKIGTDVSLDFCTKLDRLKNYIKRSGLVQILALFNNQNLVASRRSENLQIGMRSLMDDPFVTNAISLR